MAVPPAAATRPRAMRPGQCDVTGVRSSDRRGSATSSARPPSSGVRRDAVLRLGREIMLTRVSITVTVAAFALFAVGMVSTSADAIGDGSERKAIEGLVFSAVVTFLVYGNLVYQLARLGYLHRRRDHRPASRDELDQRHESSPGPLWVLVPSYKEERQVVRQTLLSAALQEFPDKHVVLLIDDPPDPVGDGPEALLAAARALPADVEGLLSAPGGRARAALEGFEARRRRGGRAASDLPSEAGRLAGAYEDAARWLDEVAGAEPTESHTDALFVEQVLRAPASSYRDEARKLLDLADGGGRLSEGRLRLGFRRLNAVFDARVIGFERKRYVNLSHQPNKAMNLNSYIGLLGGCWREVERDDGLHLEATEGNDGFTVPDPAYLVTLDADSLLLPTYALRLVHEMERPGNERLAVAQTPYSAVPDAPGVLERMAGATTDLQYIVHQGFTRYDATFWVGANAVIRKDALDDISSTEVERGFVVQRYIHDRTVIEDTESSVDLVDRGWRLVNYPDRMSFSATPPDFGALVIQRRRWANGGLIILPKLLRYLLACARRRRGALGEGLMRVHYLTSIAGVNTGLILLLGYPLDAPAASVWLPLAALPYFVIYSRDLRQAGYRTSDVLRVYALNLLLVPVNLGGVVKSLQQACTRRRIPFGRTPKVGDRTPVPALYVVAPLLLLTYWAFGSLVDASSARWIHAGFGALNVALLALAVRWFIGWAEVVSDLRRSLTTAWLRARGGGARRAARRPGGG